MGGGPRLSKNKQEQWHIHTKQHCSNYQYHKHIEKRGPSVKGSYDYVIDL